MMSATPSHRRDGRVRPGRCKRSARYLSNPAFYLTDQGADPDPADLGWCIRRRWRVLYYSARHAAGQPLWEGVENFERLMAEILYRLSRGYEPIAPLRTPQPAGSDESPLDPRVGRFQRPSYRLFLASGLDWPDWDA